MSATVFPPCSYAGADGRPCHRSPAIVRRKPAATDFASRSIGQSQTQLPDYTETAGVRRQQTAARSGNQQCDPVGAAQAMIDVVASPNPPLHLLLGAPALDLARKDLAAKAREFDSWEKTTLGADYPDAKSTF